MDASSLAALTLKEVLVVCALVVAWFSLGALLLSVAFRLVVGIMPSYWRALGALLLSMIATSAVALVLATAVRDMSLGPLPLLVNFLVGAAVVNYLLPGADGRQIGFGKACLVELIHLLFISVLAAIIFVIALLAVGAVLLGEL